MLFLSLGPFDSYRHTHSCWFSEDQKMEIAAVALCQYQREEYSHIAWGEVSLLNSDTVFDLGFPAKGTMCPSHQFSEGHFVFLLERGGGGGHYILFIIILKDWVFKLCYQQTQSSRVN